jgi:ribosomal RNA-processing protein 9
MSSFFTKPASVKKRKREDTISSRRPQGEDDARVEERLKRDESIASSDTESETYHTAAEHDDDEGSSEAAEDETAAERRLRLAERYLQNVQHEVEETIGFDAADIDRDLIAQRLKEDVAETKGKLYKHIASSLNWGSADHTFCKTDQRTVTGVAMCEPYLYTVAQDMTVIKWELAPPFSQGEADDDKRPRNMVPRKKPRFVKRYQGRVDAPRTYNGPTSAILCIACSQSGKYLATGCQNSDLIIWDTATLKPLGKFTHHRDSVLSVSFRRNSHQLFSASKDRSIKVWMIDEMAYVETLFGHQDEIPAVIGMLGERCVSVGARDRTARLWKVVEESQLVFRGGGSGSSKSKDDGVTKETGRFEEGCIDCVALVDEETFVTGSDNGSLSLWSIQRKKPLHTIPLAHGLDPPPPPAETFGEDGYGISKPASLSKPRWITAMTSVPYADVVISGSWDGFLRAWKITEDKRRIEAMGIIGRVDLEAIDATPNTTAEAKRIVRGVVNDLACFEHGRSGGQGLCIVAAVSQEHRLGRWIKLHRKNGVVVFEVKKHDEEVMDDRIATLPQQH